MKTYYMVLPGPYGTGGSRLYANPLLASFMIPPGENETEPVITEVRPRGKLVVDGLGWQTDKEPLPLMPISRAILSPEQCVEIALRYFLELRRFSVSSAEWAEAWLSGKDRTGIIAETAPETVWMTERETSPGHAICVASALAVGRQGTARAIAAEAVDWATYEYIAREEEARETEMAETAVAQVIAIIPHVLNHGAL